MITIYPIHAHNGIKEQGRYKGMGLISLVIAFHRNKRKYISTGIHVAEDQWDDVRRIVKNKGDAGDLNRRIRDQIRDIWSYIDKLQGSGHTFTPAVLGNYLKAQSYDSGDFISYMQAKIPEQASLSPGTIAAHHCCLRLLKQYSNSIAFENLPQTVQAFDRWLYKNRYAVSTISKQHSIFKRYINAALNDGVYICEAASHPYRTFKAKRVPASSRVSLIMSEIQTLQQMELSDRPMYELTRDLFLFSCYTGLRFSDLVNVTRSNLQEMPSGRVLRFATVKTTKEVIIPVAHLFEGKANDIINKYMKAGQVQVFPYMANSSINHRLKKLATQAKINKHLSYHVGRHTFCTLIAYLTGNVFTVMKLAGITGVGTAMIYIKLAGDLYDKAIKEIAWSSLG